MHIKDVYELLIKTYSVLIDADKELADEGENYKDRLLCLIAFCKHKITNLEEELKEL